MVKNDRDTYQWRALFRLQSSLQVRRKWTNVCIAGVPCCAMFLLAIFVLIIRFAINDPDTDDGGLFTPPFDVSFIGNSNAEECLVFFQYASAVDVGTLTPTNGTGVYSSVPQVPCNFNSMTAQTPFFNESIPYTTPEQTESAIDDLIFNTLLELMDIDQADQTGSGDPSRYRLPDGSIVIHEFNNQTGMLNYTIQAAEDLTDSNENSVFYRENTFFTPFPSLLNLIHGAYYRAVTGNSNANYFVRLANFQGDDVSAINVLNLFAPLFVSLSLVILFPTYVRSLVADKESRLREQMKISGVIIDKYWIVTYVFNYTIYAIVAIIVLVLGAIMQIEFFIADPFPAILLLFSWGHAQIAISFFTAALLRQNRVIQDLVMYFWALATTFTAYGVSFAFAPPGQDLPWYLMIFPHMAMVRGWMILGFNCFEEEGTSACLNTGDLVIEQEFSTVFLYLWFFWLAYLIAAWYLDQVIPQKFGVPRSPLFIFTDPYKFIRKRFFESEDSEQKYLATDEFELEDQEDEDVTNERKYIIDNPDLDAAVVIRGLSKIFNKRKKNKKIAVNNLYLHMNYGETFGLLGPNGAGKSTLISILTGIYTQTYGTAEVHGFNTKSDIESVHLSLGYCPQHDTLWNDLTVREHLLFYARLKGISADQEAMEVDDWATRLGLESLLDRPAGKMSGGQQRRLSIGNALIGAPDIVLLDEPSTGLDPTTKRHLWKVLSEARTDKTLMILTTHSMEEADTLCNRLSIIAQGKLQALGNSNHLKEKFGSGFSISLLLKDPTREQEAVDFIKELLPQAVLISAVGAERTFHSKLQVKIGEAVRLLEKNRERLGVEQFSISRTTLEDVFLNICREHESSGDISTSVQDQ